MSPAKERWFSKFVDEEIPSLQDKVVVITGTTSGTGYWAAVAAIRKSASHLLLLNRSSQRSDDSFQKLDEERVRVESKSKLIKVECDLMQFDSVRAAAMKVNEIVSTLGGLDVLINNAGIAYFKDLRTSDGYEVQCQVNHLSHFLLTCLLFKSLETASETRGEARVVTHSSAARFMASSKMSYFKETEPGSLGGDGFQSKFQRYAQSKIANCLFTFELHRRLQEMSSKIKSVVAEPGIATTSVLNTLAGEKSQNFIQRGLSKAYLAAAATLVPKQSAQDGALCLVKASFGTEVSSGDFFAPNGFCNATGLPKKVVSKARSQWLVYGERNILNKASAEELWRVSEQAVKEKFTMT